MAWWTGTHRSGSEHLGQASSSTWSTRRRREHAAPLAVIRENAVIAQLMGIRKRDQRCQAAEEVKRVSPPPSPAAAEGPVSRAEGSRISALSGSFPHCRTCRTLHPRSTTISSSESRSRDQRSRTPGFICFQCSPAGRRLLAQTTHPSPTLACRARCRRARSSLSRRPAPPRGMSDRPTGGFHRRSREGHRSRSPATVRERERDGAGPGRRVEAGRIVEGGS